MEARYAQRCRDLGESLQVSPEVHPDDFIFKFLFDHPGFKTKEAAIEHYFNDGANSVVQLKSILTDICKFNGTHIDMLEFASGYGCLTRHMKNILPFVGSTACDIHEKAIEFIENTLEAKAVLSCPNPEDFRLEKKYDVVFALSFFSHMPKRTFTLWLNSLAGCLKPGGYLVFTTHGLLSSKFVPKCRFDEEGFYFYADSEQKDLAKAEYGMTVTTPEYVIGRICNATGLSLKFFREGYWWGHQDLYVVRAPEEKPGRSIRDVVKSLISLRPGWFR